MGLTVFNGFLEVYECFRDFPRGAPIAVGHAPIAMAHREVRSRADEDVLPCLWMPLAIGARFIRVCPYHVGPGQVLEIVDVPGIPL